MAVDAANGEPTGCFAEPGHAEGDDGVEGERHPKHHLLRAESCQRKREARYEQKTERTRSTRTPLPRDHGQYQRCQPCCCGRPARGQERDDCEESREREHDWPLTTPRAGARRRDDQFHLQNAESCRRSHEGADGLKSAALTRGGIGEGARLIALINQSISVVVILAVLGIAISTVHRLWRRFSGRLAVAHTRGPSFAATSQPRSASVAADREIAYRSAGTETAPDGAARRCRCRQIRLESGAPRPSSRQSSVPRRRPPRRRESRSHSATRCSHPGSAHGPFLVIQMELQPETANTMK